MAEETEGTSRKLITLFYGVLLAAGLTLYIGWGMMYGSWNILDIDNIAIYTFFVVLVGMGVAGFLLYGRKLEIQ